MNVSKEKSLYQWFRYGYNNKILAKAEECYRWDGQLTGKKLNVLWSLSGKRV